MNPAGTRRIAYSVRSYVHIISDPPLFSAMHLDAPVPPQGPEREPRRRSIAIGAGVVADVDGGGDAEDDSEDGEAVGPGIVAGAEGAEAVGAAELAELGVEVGAAVVEGLVARTRPH